MKTQSFATLQSFVMSTTTLVCKLIFAAINKNGKIHY